MRNINAMIVPTGIGARIGGFAGDANPACKLLAKASDLLITHPNVVNAAVLTDIAPNVVVVEGYLLDRFFAGQVALRLNTQNTIAVVVDSAATAKERELVQTCIDAARQVYGIKILDEIFYTDETIVASNLRKIGNHITLLNACARARDAGATALAVMAVLDEDAEPDASKAYAQGQGHDPIGLIEAKISHMVSQFFLLPSAHAPIMRSSQTQTVVHPKVAAEFLSDSFLASVLKTLQNSPQVVPVPQARKLLDSDFVEQKIFDRKIEAADLTIEKVGNLVVPYDCCNSVPMIEAHKHDIQLICVENNTTNLEDTADLHGIPHVLVGSYLEAAGYLLANTQDRFFIDPKAL